jgi:hypothetical protein
VAKKKKRVRTARRRLERELGKIGDAREKLAQLSSGGASERPIDVTSASVVESTALGLRCARCESALRLEDHEAIRTPHGILRRVRTRCTMCRASREVWLRIMQPS